MRGALQGAAEPLIVHPQAGLAQGLLLRMEMEMEIEQGRAVPPARRAAQMDWLINEFISGNWPVMRELLSKRDCALQPT